MVKHVLTINVEKQAHAIHFGKRLHTLSILNWLLGACTYVNTYQVHTGPSITVDLSSIH